MACHSLQKTLNFVLNSSPLSGPTSHAPLLGPSLMKNVSLASPLRCPSRKQERKINQWYFHSNVVTLVALTSVWHQGPWLFMFTGKSLPPPLFFHFLQNKQSSRVIIKTATVSYCLEILIFFETENQYMYIYYGDTGHINIQTFWQQWKAIKFPILTECICPMPIYKQVCVYLAPNYYEFQVWFKTQYYSEKKILPCSEAVQKLLPTS